MYRKGDLTPPGPPIFMPTLVQVGFMFRAQDDEFGLLFSFFGSILAAHARWFSAIEPLKLDPDPDLLL
jgi:hypothetical protein